MSLANEIQYNDYFKCYYWILKQKKPIWIEQGPTVAQYELQLKLKMNKLLANKAITLGGWFHPRDHAGGVGSDNNEKKTIQWKN